MFTEMISGKKASAFTFQSDYIQISPHVLVSDKVFSFTFQSGYIQMPSPNFLPHNIRTLHSNLVIFKCNNEVHSIVHVKLYIPIWLYSNVVGKKLT